jgi:hypothetical protein
MGHNISAVVLRGPFDQKKALSFDLKPIPLTAELTLFPLDASYVDYCAEKLGIGQSLSDFPLLNTEPILHMICSIAKAPRFAVINTDYFGGRGSQAAVAYEGAAELMPAEHAQFGICPPGLFQFAHGDIALAHQIGPINRALRLLGVIAKEGCDEFDTIGLGRFRDFYDLFDAYHDQK